MTLTPGQLKVTNAITGFRRTHGISPSLRELARDLSCSKSTVLCHIEALERKGAVRRQRYSSRSLEVLLDGSHAPKPIKNLQIEGEIVGKKLVKASVVGLLVDLERLFESSNGVYALRISGDGWKHLHLESGDDLIIERSDRPRKGAAVVFINSQGSPDIGAWPIAEVKVLGVVIGMLRRAA